MAISFDRVADLYDNTRSLPPEIAQAVTDCILWLSRATPETSFFEPGIGTGRIALPLVEQGYAYTGIDVSDAMMDKLWEKLKDRSHRLTLLNADATALPFEPACFDVAIASHILHLIPDWRKAMAEIRRVLKPEGVFIYFHHPNRGVATYHEVDQKWEEILTRYAYQRNVKGAFTEEVLAHLTEQGAELETVTVAEVKHTRTLAEVLQAYCDRIYSSFWQIPDEIFNAALQDLLTWANDTFSSQEIQIESSYSLILTAAYQWASRV
ncbi:MAG TPA: class I SAM-dependent methyltransferase [Leptolyngbyaceae cyanobacterium]